MLDAARELQLTQMRWPGGNFVAGYDWRDGIGPKDKRPKRMELAWGVVESNQVGTDEWVQLNKEIGTENVTCINMGTGTLDDARYWVEYCNAPVGTYWAGSSTGVSATRLTAHPGSSATRTQRTM
jgi:alpha-N-arabinofuranosidase